MNKDNKGFEMFYCVFLCTYLWNILSVNPKPQYATSALVLSITLASSGSKKSYNALYKSDIVVTVFL